MCILMYFAPEAFPTRDHLENACRNNPDGFGWAIVTLTAGIVTGHSMDAAEAIDGFLADRKVYPAESAVFHARIATHGSTSLDNCHPFQVQHRFMKGENRAEVAGDMWLAHNGILPCQPVKGDRRSDTRILAQDVLMRRFPHLDSAKTRRRFEEWMGGSKVVILTTDPAYRQQSYIFNSNLGHWLKGEDGVSDVWYSNTSYERRSYTGYSYSYIPWPTVVGGRSEEWAESWSSAEGRRYGGYTLACVECRYAILECLCAGTVQTAYLRTEDVRSVEESDNPKEWVCNNCYQVGTINEDAMCAWCGVMYCCDQPVTTCQCWGTDGTLDVGKAVQALNARGVTDL